ncbi:hypothetical protein Anapl_02029 [Anas platyrhynchos]|uniref:Uncharacterized protein n=1 Tax=Anas platyrhynchos TaxID=8839 RepID=R0KAZ5_ANAPL|nr:hypothetical protein Anapl_02029 [Anas platyrhynchos]
MIIAPPRLPALGRRFSQCRTAPTVPRPCRVMASGQQRRTWTCSCYNAVASPAAHSVQLRVGLPLALAASCSSFEAAVARGFKKMSAAATSRGTAHAMRSSNQTSAVQLSHQGPHQQQKAKSQGTRDLKPYRTRQSSAPSCRNWRETSSACMGKCVVPFSEEQKFTPTCGAWEGISGLLAERKKQSAVSLHDMTLLNELRGHGDFWSNGHCWSWRRFGFLHENVQLCAEMSKREQHKIYHEDLPGYWSTRGGEEGHTRGRLQRRKPHPAEPTDTPWCLVPVIYLFPRRLWKHSGLTKGKKAIQRLLTEGGPVRCGLVHFSGVERLGCPTKEISAAKSPIRHVITCDDLGFSNTYRTAPFSSVFPALPTVIALSMDAMGEGIWKARRGSKEGPGSYRDGIAEDVVLVLRSTHMKQKLEKLLLPAEHLRPVCIFAEMMPTAIQDIFGITENSKQHVIQKEVAALATRLTLSTGGDASGRVSLIIIVLLLRSSQREMTRMSALALRHRDQSMLSEGMGVGEEQDCLALGTGLKITSFNTFDIEAPAKGTNRCTADRPFSEDRMCHFTCPRYVLPGRGITCRTLVSLPCTVLPGYDIPLVKRCQTSGTHNKKHTLTVSPQSSPGDRGSRLSFLSYMIPIKLMQFIGLDPAPYYLQCCETQDCPHLPDNEFNISRTEALNLSETWKHRITTIRVSQFLQPVSISGAFILAGQHNSSNQHQGKTSTNTALSCLWQPEHLLDILPHLLTQSISAHQNQMQLIGRR